MVSFDNQPTANLPASTIFLKVLPFLKKKQSIFFKNNQIEKSYFFSRLVQKNLLLFSDSKKFKVRIWAIAQSIGK